MNSKIYGACAHQVAPIDSGSTPNVSITSEHTELPTPQAIPFNRHWVEDEWLGSLIKEQAPATIFTINKYQEHVLIHAYDNQTILATSRINGSAKLIYKHAVSTIGRIQLPNGKTVVQPTNPQFISNFSELDRYSTSLEKLFLDKLIADCIEVSIALTSGFQTSGLITGYDEGVIECFLDGVSESSIMYKHVISTITIK